MMIYVTRYEYKLRNDIDKGYVVYSNISAEDLITITIDDSVIV